MKVMIKKYFLLFCLSINYSCANNSSIVIDSPTNPQALTPKFEKLDVSFLSNEKSKDELISYKQYVEQLNPYNSVIWQRKYWDLDYYNTINLPIAIGTLDQKEFSKRYNNVGLRFLDLPIYMPKQGWQIPIELEQFKELIQKVVEHERICMPDFEKNHYVYITVDQAIVEPNSSQRRAGWHGDSYRKINTHLNPTSILVDHVYIAYDSCPTLFIKGPCDMGSINPEDITQVLKHFSDVASTQTPVTYPNYTILRLDPYCIHDAGINQSSNVVYRTFVKISISKLKYAHLGNAYNNLFHYDWPMTPRPGVPYTKEAIQLSDHRNDRDEFMEIDPSEIDFLHKINSSSWSNPHVYTMVKIGTLYAELATEGEVLETKNDNFLITINVAQKGDYKVYFDSNDYGFIAAEKFKQLFSPVLNQKNLYSPKKIIRRAVQLTKNARMRAPWGTMHYACAGDYLMYINEDEIYFVPKKIIEKSYEILD